jgi:hypothetical protein
MKRILALAAITCAVPALAQQFTTAAEVKPILSATKANWVALREYDGKDLLYFTHLLAWRCGLDAVHYSVNGESEKQWRSEPCYESEVQPNAIKATDVLPFIGLPLQSVQSVAVRVIYDDGSEETAKFQRASILMQ